MSDIYQYFFNLHDRIFKVPQSLEEGAYFKLRGLRGVFLELCNFLFPNNNK